MATNNSWNNQIAAANSAITLNAGTNSISLSSNTAATTVNVGTGDGLKSITIGSTTDGSSVTLQCGTGNFSLHSASYSLMAARSTGEINYNRQPCFLAYLSGLTGIPVTGDGTVRTVPCDVTVFDQDLNYTTPNTFTATVAGKHLFNCEMWLTGFTASTTTLVANFVTSNATYTGIKLNPRAIETSVDMVFIMEIMTYMDIGDTTTVTVQVSGDVSKVVRIVASGSAGFRTPTFSGKLLC